MRRTSPTRTFALALLCAAFVLLCGHASAGLRAQSRPRRAAAAATRPRRVKPVARPTLPAATRRVKEATDFFDGVERLVDSYLRTAREARRIP